MMQKQKGMSFFGFIIIAMVVGMAVVVAFKVLPTYIEYFNIKKAMNTVASQNAGATPAAIREAYSKHAMISDIESVDAQGLQISQVGGNTTIQASYEKVVPLVANISFLFQFEVEANSASAE
ncbi:DUF4845 domain-containing protein [Chitinibacter sp. S2-10]|uniref:DUF4845 domain-containing protein n=1 Tax=Chitinibacter sp. S2-10 TaxID=3373597 RepID=UPI0039772541